MAWNRCSVPWMAVDKSVFPVYLSAMNDPPLKLRQSIFSIILFYPEFTWLDACLSFLLTFLSLFLSPRPVPCPVIPHLMDQLTSSLAPPRSMPKSAVADSPQDVAGSVTKRCVLTTGPQSKVTNGWLDISLSSELMTLMVRSSDSSLYKPHVDSR